MFRLSHPEREAFERLLKEKERQIDILAEQIDYLRGQIAFMGRPSAATKSLNPTAQPAMILDATPWVSEDEEDLQHMHRVGELSTEELERALAQMNFLNHQIDVTE